MKWTRDKPTEIGWYWLRETDRFCEAGVSIRVEYVRWYGRELCIMNWPIPENKEWAGPIPEPKEDQNGV